MTTPEEAAHRIMERDAPAFLVEGKLGSDAVTVARALLAADYIERLRAGRAAVVEEYRQAAILAREEGFDSLADHFDTKYRALKGGAA